MTNIVADHDVMRDLAQKIVKHEGAFALSCRDQEHLAVAYLDLAKENELLRKVAEASLKLQEHWQAEGHGRYACAGEADFLEAITAWRSRCKT